MRTLITVLGAWLGISIFTAFLFGRLASLGARADAHLHRRHARRRWRLPARATLLPAGFAAAGACLVLVALSIRESGASPAQMALLDVPAVSAVTKAPEARRARSRPLRTRRAARPGRARAASPVAIAQVVTTPRAVTRVVATSPRQRSRRAPAAKAKPSPTRAPAPKPTAVVASKPAAPPAKAAPKRHGPPAHAVAKGHQGGKGGKGKK